MVSGCWFQDVGFGVAGASLVTVELRLSEQNIPQQTHRPTKTALYDVVIQ